MATPQLKLDGSVSGPGVVGQSRDDFVLAETVTITDAANGAGVYSYIMNSRPVGSAAVLSGAATDTATFVPDVEGTYLITLTFNGTDKSFSLNADANFVSTQGGAGVKLANGTRIPAASETLQFSALEGWHTALDPILRTHDSQIPSVVQKADLVQLDGAPQGTLWFADAAGRVTRLPPGAAGEFLQTQGAGVDPAYAGSLVEAEDEGVVVASHPTFNFIGAAVTATDDIPNDRINVTITAAALTASAPASIEPDDVAAVGVAIDAARADHQHAIVAAPAGTVAVGDTASEGVAISFSRSDHQHALQAPAAPADVTKAVAAAGVATTVARSDHKHDVATAAPVNTAQANTEGVATQLARADHVHRTLVEAEDEGVVVSSRPTLNFSGPVIVTDDIPNDRINVTITVLGYTLPFGGNIKPAQVGDFASANGATDSSSHPVLAEEAEITVPRAGVMNRLTWNTQSADGTTVLKIHKNQVVVETITLTGATGTAALTVAIAVGDQLAIEYDAGTAPDRGNYIIYVE